MPSLDAKTKRRPTGGVFLFAAMGSGPSVGEDSGGMD